MQQNDYYEKVIDDLKSENSALAVDNVGLGECLKEAMELLYQAGYADRFMLQGIRDKEEVLTAKIQKNFDLKWERPDIP